jgi:oxygen-independent coproporphyrinogen-3 oxidase
MRELGLYLHFPFCQRKCNYCDFPSYQGMESWMLPYIEALKAEIEEWGHILKGYRIKTIFMGGGTPTLFSGAQIAGILDICNKNFNIKSHAEITIEANPGTIDSEKLSILKQAGVNRLSLGFQAWQHKHLKLLGRIHGNTELFNDVKWAREEGFQNISVDVMFGLPGQTVDEWLETLERICTLGIQHISMYSLKVEEGTPLYQWYKEGKLQLPTQEEDRLMYHSGREYVLRFGLKQYEISNFAIPGRECAHNLIYWHNEEYIGCGSAAHSCFNKERFSNKKDIKAYIKAVMMSKERTDYRELIDNKDERFETIMLGLRLNEGINKRKYAQRFGKDINYYYEDVIKRFKEQKLLTENSESIRLTNKGIDLQNVVLLDFMD